jgi:type IV pilus assembly protein PilE
MKITKNGFTLIELIVVIAIIGIIMAYAIPSYQRQVIRTKRTEAHNVLTQISARQEKNNAVFLQYASTIAAGNTPTADDLGYAGIAFMSSPDYLYTMDNTNAYTITATAQGATQINDTFGPDNCTVLTLNSLGQKTPLTCWQ